jgi:hypothetical protein
LLAFRGTGGEPPRRKRLRGLTCPAAPAGVSHFRSNQPKIVFVLKQQSLENSPINLDNPIFKETSLLLSIFILTYFIFRKVNLSLIFN